MALQSSISGKVRPYTIRVRLVLIVVSSVWLGDNTGYGLTWDFNPFLSTVRLIAALRKRLFPSWKACVDLNILNTVMSPHVTLSFYFFRMTSIS